MEFFWDEFISILEEGSDDGDLCAIARLNPEVARQEDPVSDKCAHEKWELSWIEF